MLYHANYQTISIEYFVFNRLTCKKSKLGGFIEAIGGAYWNAAAVIIQRYLFQKLTD